MKLSANLPDIVEAFLWALACMLLLSLSGCSTPTKPDPIVQLETVVLEPPANLLQDTPVPAEPATLTGATWAVWTAELIEAAQQCNGDKAALRAWAAEHRDDR